MAKVCDANGERNATAEEESKINAINAQLKTAADDAFKDKVLAAVTALKAEGKL